ncbi:plakophilin-3a isoform X2 [Amia ocellicauda]|uniref:plakophilin-3a isoform X2 n=1 Tax=Amia ocellicauda TaxID=2972642 RepID=UPI0034641015
MPNTMVSSYAVPSEIHLGHGGGLSDSVTRAKRVQEQVALRLAEKTSSTMPRMNGSAQVTSSEYGGSSTMRYSTYTPGFSSKSQMYTSSRAVAAPRGSQYGNGTMRGGGGFSSRSAVDFGQRQKVSMGGSGMMQQGGYQTRQTVMRSMSRAGGGGGGGGRGPDLDTMSMRSLQLRSLPPQVAAVNNWRDDSEGSLVSDRDATVNRHSMYSTVTDGGFYGAGGGAAVRQVGGSVSTMRRSLSGTLSRAAGGEMIVAQEELPPQQSYKGPAYRTISRINQRRTQTSSAMAGGGGMYQAGSMMGGGGGVYQSSSGGQMLVNSIPRAMSVKSLHSVGRGMDVFDGEMDMMGMNEGFTNLTMPTAISYLSQPDPEMQVLGSAFIQHECYHNNDAKNQVRLMKGIPALVKLFNSENQEVQRYTTGAMRNIIYENMDNKTGLIEAGGVPQLIQALKEPDDELRKNVTGILWNLSSKDSLKEKLARDTLADLTEHILIPLSSDSVTQSASETEIFLNTTGCLRNLSSVNSRTRQQMRETTGLVDALVEYIQNSLENGKAEEKGMENAVCVLRNLSYQLYGELPPSTMARLEGPSRGQGAGGKGDAIGCFTPQSKKAKERQNQDLSTFTEVIKDPQGQQLLWHPQVVGLYNRVLQRCEINTTTREAGAGALQNITAGEKRWASVLSKVALEQERMLPVVLDLLRTNNDPELRSLTGFMKNLSRHAKNKNDMATKVVNNLISKLPTDGHQKTPSSDVVVNICGVLNNLVTCSIVAARDITFFDGLQKLVAIKNSFDSNPDEQKAAKAASTVLSNMFQYKKLHSDYKQKGFTKHDFTDSSF